MASLLCMPSGWLAGRFSLLSLRRTTDRRVPRLLRPMIITSALVRLALASLVGARCVKVRTPGLDAGSMARPRQSNVVGRA